MYMHEPIITIPTQVLCSLGER